MPRIPIRIIMDYRCLHRKSHRLLKRCHVRGHRHTNSATTYRQCFTPRRDQSLTSDGRNDHSMSTLRDTLHWLPVSQRIIFKVALMTFDCISGRPPAYFRDVCVITGRLRSLSLPASLCWQRWHDRATYSDYALWSAHFPCHGWHPGSGTRYHLISRTLISIVNSLSRALTISSLCKPILIGRTFV